MYTKSISFSENGSTIYNRFMNCSILLLGITFLISSFSVAQNTHPTTDNENSLYLLNYGINSSHLDLDVPESNYSKHLYLGLSKVDKVTEYIDLSYGIMIVSRGYTTHSSNVRIRNNYFDIPVSIKINSIKSVDFELGLNTGILFQSYQQYSDGTDDDNIPERVAVSNYPRLLLEPIVGLDIKLHTDYSLNIKYSIMRGYLNRETLWVGVSYILNHNNIYKRIYRNGIDY